MVNIVTEVTKSVLELKNAKIINITVLLISLIFTMVSLFAFCQIKGILVTWYMVFAGIVLSYMVAYAAMFGYDKLLSYFKELRGK